MKPSNHLIRSAKKQSKTKVKSLYKKAISVCQKKKQ